MSRPSRGFTVSAPRAKSSPLCPTTGTTGTEQFGDDDIGVFGDWSPDVSVGTFALFVRVNGGTSTHVATGNDVTSGGELEVTPSDWGNSGDTLSFFFDCSDVGGCPDFVTTPVDYLVP